MAEQLSDAEKRRLITSTRRFDLRRILGALFVFYGVVVTIVGLVRNTQDMAKTHGIPINLWTGIAMLVLGILFFVWDRFSPVPEGDIIRNEETEPDANESARQAEGA
jgi:prolipoprotein diacylglyceryltransferase